MSEQLDRKTFLASARNDCQVSKLYPDKFSSVEKDGSSVFSSHPDISNEFLIPCKPEATNPQLVATSLRGLGWKR